VYEGRISQEKRQLTIVVDAAGNVLDIIRIA
jgi:hypothetical protein